MVVDALDNLPDSEIIRQIIYEPIKSLYAIATLGNMTGSIFDDKIKTLNPGEWLNDEVVNFIIRLMLQGETCLCEQNLG